MLTNRVVPVLLLSDGLLVKTQRFKKARYVGDPINAVRIFNEKEVDELVVLDMDPSKGDASIRLELLEQVVSEAFMPVAYGGGIRSVEQAKQVVSAGIEKVIVNTYAHTNRGLVAEIASVLGSQAVVGGIDYKRGKGGRMDVCIRGGRKSCRMSPAQAASSLVDQGVGEILLQAIDQDGMMNGLDNDVIRDIAAGSPVPILACGGAGMVEHLQVALEAGASAVGAGSMFVFHGKHRAVLLSYPDRQVLDRLGAVVPSVGRPGASGPRG